MRSALLAMSVLGCNAVLGLDERARAVDVSIEDSALASDSAVVDTSNSTDGEPVDEDTNAPPPDTGTSGMFDTGTSGMFDTGVDTGADAAPSPCGTPCTGEKKCIAGWTASTETYAYECISPVVITTKPFGPCAKISLTSPQYCAEGYSCGWMYPGKQACLPWCTTDSTCTDPTAPFCSYRVSSTTKHCGPCDPRGGIGECSTLKERCMIVNGVSAPTCTPDFGSGGAGVACTSSASCQNGYVCECVPTTAGGVPRLGTECAAVVGATCKKLCGPGTACSSGLTCSAIGATGYSVCR